ncbi:MAG: MarC family NAAT transporter [Balneolaceae bacterium]|nr:MarC family NAAT transporter [Balneolaceae bacterium]MBO6545665.1 MarC family NAAT transporter [Balneolaceae bacterium]MBO6647061.1 MarC family NAAT transporter [Balneolaceae bacterium]
MEDFIKEIIPFSTAVMGTGALLLASFSSLFSVVNPITAMPVFMSLTEDESDKEKARTARKASMYMFCVLIIFLLAGTYILSFFGISLPGIRIAGGLVIMRAGYSMLNPETGGRKLSSEDQEAAKDKEDVSFSPLAMPLLSGPGSIAVVIGFGSQATSIVDYIVNGVAVFLVALMAWGILRVAPWLNKLIGKSGMTVITRMMGFIALAIGVQFVINGIAKFYGIG